MNFIFDLYGTLIDIWTDESRCELWEGVALLLGDGEEKAKSVKEEYLSLCRKAYKGEGYELNLLLVFEKMLENRGIDKSRASEFARKFRLLSREKLKLFPHVCEMLCGLRQKGAGVYLVSNAQSCFTRDELDELGIAPLFDGILISSEAGVKKPYGEIFSIALEKFGLNREECFYVGNDLHDDVLGANGAGLKTVYIETEQSGRYPSLDIVPDYVVENHKEMMEKLFLLAK